MAGIILDAVAVADLCHHREIVIGAPFQPLDFQELAFRFQFLQARCKLRADRLERLFLLILVRDEVLGREEEYVRQRPDDPLRYRIDLGDAAEFPADDFQEIDELLRYRHDLDAIAETAELPGIEIGIGALEEDRYQPMQ